MWIPQIFAVNDIRSKSPSCFFWSLTFFTEGFCCWKNKVELLKPSFDAEFGRMRCTWKEAGFLAYIFTNERDCMIYSSSFIHLLRIIYSSYWIWRVCSFGDVEGGWILRPPIIHGRGCGALLEQSPRYRGGSMKVQIRKYDGIGCGAQEARLVWGKAQWHRLSLIWDLSWVYRVWLIWSHLSLSWDSISQPVQPNRTAQVCLEDASAVQAQPK